MKTKIISYKGFDKNLKCKGFQYEIGKTYNMKGKPVRCTSSGFHSCENPFDIWDYYDVTDSRFAECEASGDIDKDGEDSKMASSKLTIKAEISLKTIIDFGIKFMLKICKDYSKQVASGYSSKQAASGYSSKQAASGDSSTQAASGDYSKQAASGYYSTQAASGYYSTQAASGYYSKQAASGYSSKQAASGDSSTQVASGYYSKQAASGDYSTQAASGYYSTQAASGDSSTQAASGDSSKLELNGKYSIGAGIGRNCKIKAKKGNWITLAEWKYDNKENRYVPKCVKSAKVDGISIKENTWYELKNGKFIKSKSKINERH